MKLESNRIKELRTKHHITIIKLAECIGTSVSTLIAWEKGVKRPNELYQKKMARVFGVSPRYLMSQLTDIVADEGDKLLKRCQYCHQPYTNVITGLRTALEIECDNQKSIQPYLIIKYPDDSGDLQGVNDEIAINYCPFCGRAL
ncbi:XRE family transcriptional regulator [Limosilactobacillus reuteri]|uniref:XRE family transcriptional regulator n=1 Tax=Limosilactobacillus reuteri TaxID=1598 RepID=A0A3M6SAI3_LIMRT|nr:MULTISPECIES: helix-turn-helix transcriptional regulator [Limosilactobacillus]MBB1109462.1 helix-turn-helix transcriptional regulator [Limosilactobacillus balticus]OTA77831.1 hypothetical protein BHL80_01100 [Limosilactobacillus reuteri]RMX24415.1 XRE family transcriptional regulator [Limosilactobacillus reuteri]